MDKIKITKVEDVQILARARASTGTLHLMPHHLVIIEKPPKRLEDETQDGKTVPKPKPREMWITYPIIASCVFRPMPPGSGLASSIRLRGRDFTFVTLNFTDDQQAREVFESIRSLTCKLGRNEKLYAFSYRPVKIEKDFNGWEIYDAKAEWRRQGISEKGVDKGWRLSTINADYGLCPTYPSLLAVPTTISDNVLNYAGRFRSKVRIPALTYLHPVNNCAITRSAQPLTGIRGNRSAQDERLVSACCSAQSANNDISENATPNWRLSPSSSQNDLPSSLSEATDVERNEDEMITDTPDLNEKFQVYGAQRHNLIVDARPQVNALAQQAAGAGSETMDNYKFAKKVYLGIDNIHVMRKSLAKVIEAIKDSDITPLPPNRELLAKSGWLKHINGLLDGSALIARQVGVHHSHVLIHCSDGWDRTSQLSALSQLMLDPYYRTLEGFIVLVEKDFLSFGHMFQHRSGFLNSEKWFTVQNDGLAGSAIQPGGKNDGRSEALENAFASAKRFFNKKPENSDDMVDSEGEMIPFDESPKPGKKNTEKEFAADSEATKPSETSPVFHQFLDATYQLIRQHPTRFEFNERFLRRLLYHLYSCQYGTFLYNSEKARLDADLRHKTRSVWDYFLARRDDFTNKEYDGGEVDDTVKGRERLVFPHLDKTRWWYEVFGRTDEEMNGPVNLASEKYLGPTAEGQGRGIMIGVESSIASSGDTPRQVSGGNQGGLQTIRDGIAGLGFNIGKNPPHRPKSPGTKSELEVEMQ